VAAVSEDGLRSMRSARSATSITERSLEYRQDALPRGHSRGLRERTARAYFRDVTIRSALAVETRFVSWGTGVADLGQRRQPGQSAGGDGQPSILRFERNSLMFPSRRPRVASATGQRPVRGIDPEAGPGVEARTPAAAARFGHFDNDRRRGYPDRQPERTALARFATTSPRQSLAQGQAVRR